MFRDIRQFDSRRVVEFECCARIIPTAEPAVRSGLDSLAAQPLELRPVRAVSVQSVRARRAVPIRHTDIIPYFWSVYAVVVLKYEARLVMAWLVWALQGVVRQGIRGLAGRGSAGRGKAGQGRARFGREYGARLAVAAQGSVGQGAAW